MNSAEQELAISKMKAGQNVFLSGSGGSGKSYTARQVVDHNTVVCAPTGVAALNIGGMTCHRAFGLPIGVPDELDFKSVSGKVKDLFSPYSPVNRILIDEVSMLRADQLHLIDSKLKLCKKNNLPFGGIQVIVLGDFYQTSPILTHHEEGAYKEFYDSIYAFTRPEWNFHTVELNTPFRNTNNRQVKLLESIRRKDKHYKLALDYILADSKKYEPSPDTTHLCCYNQSVRKYNNKYYKQVAGKEFIYNADIDGNDKWSDSVVPHELKLKVGVRVMFKSNDQNGDYVNGEKGVVEYLDKVCISVRKESGDTVQVLRNKWDKYSYKVGVNGLEKEITSTFEQYPLVLSYGQSIHSSQSLTLNDAVIDVGRGCFSSGMLYVALSRVRDLKNLSFVGNVKYSDVICAREVKQFYRGEFDKT